MRGVICSGPLVVERCSSIWSVVPGKVEKEEEEEEGERENKERR